MLLRSTPPARLNPSEIGILKIIDFESGGRYYFEEKLSSPSWPGGASGVTIGIGYDLGYVSPDEFELDWIQMRRAWREELKTTIGKKKAEAERLIDRLSHIKVGWKEAIQVFRKRTIPKYSGMTLSAYPGIELMDPDIQAAILSLVFNRGASKDGESRREMKQLEQAILDQDTRRMAALIRSMKRLWDYNKLRGLHLRREAEAQMIENADARAISASRSIEDKSPNRKREIRKGLLRFFGRQALSALLRAAIQRLRP